MPFSVLLSIYQGTTASELAQCLESLCQQTLQADEIIVVKDGPITSDTDACLTDFINRLPLILLAYETNRGLGPALQDGLKRCSNEFVARVDTDDLCRPERFYTQVQFLTVNQEISVIGGGLEESYINKRAHHKVVRNGPTTPIGVVNCAKKRNPLNHPTVMFRKSDVISCGGYERCDFFEDYLLWAKMIVSGYHLINISDILVETVVSPDYFRRRGGISYIANEIHLNRRFRQIGFFSRYDSFVFLSTRIPVRLLPTRYREYVYQSYLRQTHFFS